MFKKLENGIKGTGAVLFVILCVLLWALVALLPTLVIAHFVIKYW